MSILPVLYCIPLPVLYCIPDIQMEVLRKLAPSVMGQVVVTDAAAGSSDDNPVCDWTLQQEVGTYCMSPV